MTASEPKIHAIFSVSEARDLEGLLREFIEFVTEDLLRVADVTFDPDALAENTLGSLTKFVPPNGRCWVARAEDGTQLGMVFLRRVGRDAMEIKRLYVKPEARGFGLGRNLVTEAIKEARKRGAKSILLDSTKNLTDAIMLYQDLGFEFRDIYIESDHFTDEELHPHLVFMELKL